MTRQIIKHIILVLQIFAFSHISAQIGIQTDDPHSSAALEIVSSDKGLLIPRVTLSTSLSSPSPVTSPAEGLLIYNSGTNQDEGFYFWTGTAWNQLKPEEGSDVEGPTSSTDNAIVRFDGTDGSKIQNSSVILDDASNISGVNNLSTAGFTMPTNAGADYVLVSDASGNGTWQEALPLDVEEESILIAEGVNTLNFMGAVTVVDDGNNQTTITVTEATFVEEIIQLSSTSTQDVNLFTAPFPISWDVEDFKDNTAFSHSTTVNPSRITVLHNGIYEMNYMFSVENDDNQRKTLRSRIRINGTTFLSGSECYSFTYSKFDDNSTHVSSSFLIELNANDYLEILVNGQTNSGPVYLLTEENLIFVRIMRTW